MNFDYNEMLAEIMGGTDPGELARNFTEKLNAAIQEQKRVEAEKLQKEKEKREAAAAKEEAIKAAWKNLMYVFKEYYPEIYDAETAELSGPELVELFDQIYSEMTDMLKLFRPFAAAAPKVQKTEPKNMFNANAIQRFLDENGL